MLCTSWEKRTTCQCNQAWFDYVCHNDIPAVPVALGMVMKGLLLCCLSSLSNMVNNIAPGISKLAVGLFVLIVILALAKNCGFQSHRIQVIPLVGYVWMWLWTLRLKAFLETFCET